MSEGISYRWWKSAEKQRQYIFINIHLQSYASRSTVWQCHLHTCYFSLFFLSLSMYSFALFVFYNCKTRFVRLKFKNFSIEMKLNEKNIIKCLNCWQCEFVLNRLWVKLKKREKKTDNTQYNMGIFQRVVKIHSINYELAESRPCWRHGNKYKYSIWEC